MLAAPVSAAPVTLARSVTVVRGGRRHRFALSEVIAVPHRRGPDAVVDDRLPTVVALGAALMLAIGLGQLGFDTTPGILVPSLVALMTAAVLAVAGVLLWRHPHAITPANARALVTVVASLVSLNPLAYVVFTGVAYPAVGVLLVIVAIGALVPYPRIAATLIVVVNAAAIGCAAWLGTPVPLPTVILQLVKADVLAVIIAIAWQRTERRLHRANDIIRALAGTDELTGLLNRRGLDQQGDTLIAEAIRAGHRVAFGFVDIDGLKCINDRFGHAAGDEAIVGLGTALRWLLDEGHLAARIGGDEFVVLLAAAADADLAALRARLERVLAGSPNPVSVGWAEPEQGSTPTMRSLLAESDLAMMTLKRTRPRIDHAAPPLRDASG